MSSILQCLSRGFLNELTLGAVKTTSGRSFQNMAILSEKLFFSNICTSTFYNFFLNMTPCSFPCITVFVQLDNLRYITVILNNINSYVAYAGHLDY